MILNHRLTCYLNDNKKYIFWKIIFVVQKVIYSIPTSNIFKEWIDTAKMYRSNINQ